MTTERLPEVERRDAQPPPRAWLVRVGTAADPMTGPSVFPLDRPILLGRRDPDDAVSPDESVRRITCDDRWMSRAHARLHPDGEGWTVEDQGSANGTRVNGRKASRAVVRDGTLIETGSTFWIYRQAVAAPPQVDAQSTGPAASVCPAVLSVFRRAERLATSNVPIMILGETGTGKEVLARHIHACSNRTGPFVAINTAAIQPNLVASELFGVERGAHSMADRPRVGQIRSANHGTLLLDEIGDMPLDVQVTLLRVLQEREVLPVGGESPLAIDVRFLCATHQSIEDLVSSGRFRADLQARLQGTTLALPSLAERREDIGLLMGTFLRQLGASTYTFSPAAYRALVRYDWPLNIRELQKTLEAAVALCEDDQVDVGHLPEVVRAEQPAPERAPLDDDARRRELQRLLAAHRGNVSAVARSMGFSRMQVHRWLKHYQLDADAFRGPKR